MKTKTCPNCNQTKSVTEFGKDKHRKDGLYPYCKECKNRKAKESYRKPEVYAHKAAYRKEYLADPIKHAEQVERERQWFLAHKDDLDFREKERKRYKKYDQSEHGREIRRKNQQTDRAKEYARKYRQEKGQARAKERYHSDSVFRDKIRKAIKKWFQSDKGKAWKKSPKRKEYSKQYGEKNRERINNWAKEKYHNDPDYHAKVRKNHNVRIERERASGGDLRRQDWEFLIELADGKCLCCGKERKMTIDHIVPIPEGKTVIENIQPLCNSCNARKGKQTIDYRSQEFITRVTEYQSNH
jgi:5-methylcytosine-specific restriction endonuclease McrA